MLWHMLLFGDALVLHMLFFGVFASKYALFGGGQTSKHAFNRQLRHFMVVSGVHSSSVVFNACVYSSMYACMQSTLSVHRAVRPRNIPRNINRMTGCCWGVINK